MSKVTNKLKKVFYEHSDCYFCDQVVLFTTSQLGSHSNLTSMNRMLDNKAEKIGTANKQEVSWQTGKKLSSDCY